MLLVTSLVVGSFVFFTLIVLGFFLMDNGKEVVALLVTAAAFVFFTVVLSCARTRHMEEQAEMTARRVTVVKAYKIDENGNRICPECGRPVDSKEHENE